MMTTRERIALDELRIQIHARSGGRCEVCGKPIAVTETQLAHRIPQSKMNLKKYGKEIIHHRMNLAATCSLRCNAQAIVHGVAEDHLVSWIRDDIAQIDLFAMEGVE